MNWIEIDKILRKIIIKHETTEPMLKEAEALFKWNRSQSEAAVIPLLKCHTFHKTVAKTTKTASKQLRKR
jgi:hypothetical protein